jgi:multisubunit Na+/H+ antiporter MnhE subunit
VAGDRDPRGYRRATGRVAWEAGLVAAVWLLFAGSLHWHDLVVAAAVGLAATSAGAALRRQLGHHPATPSTWLPLLPSVAAGVVRDSWSVSRAFVDLARGRRVGGTVEEQPFVHRDHGSDEPRAEAATRRIVATIVATAQPNSIVIGFDRDRDVVVLHRLCPSRRPAVDRRLSAPRGTEAR